LSFLAIPFSAITSEAALEIIEVGVIVS